GRKRTACCLVIRYLGRAVCQQHIGKVHLHAVFRGAILPCNSRPSRNLSRVTVSCAGAPFARSGNLVSGTVNRENPQSKQTKSVGTAQTPGLSRFLRPEKWNTISAANYS